MRVSTGADVSSAPSIEQSVMVSEHCRGRDRDFGGRGRGFIGRECGSYGGRQPLRKAFSNASTVDAVIISSRSVGRNSVDLSGHSYLILTLLLHVALLRTFHPLSLLFLNLPQLY